MGKVNDYYRFGGMRGQPLDPKQKIILHLYSRGATLPYIAERVGYKESTVETHLKYIRYKLGSQSMPEAICKAGKLKIIRIH